MIANHIGIASILFRFGQNDQRALLAGNVQGRVRSFLPCQVGISSTDQLSDKVISYQLSDNVSDVNLVYLILCKFVVLMVLTCRICHGCLLCLGFTWSLPKF